MRTTRRRITASLLHYGVACALPAFGGEWAFDVHGIWGALCLVYLPFVLLYPACWANPLYFWACVSLARGKARRASVVSLIALVLALSFVAMTEGQALQAGFYCWVASILGLAVAAWIARQTPTRPVSIDDLAHDDSPPPDPSAAGSSSASSSSIPLSSRSPS